MKKEPRITPSKLGALCGKNPCLCCYWRLLRMSFKKPFDFGTPYIMQLLDQRHKQIARVALQEEGQLPDFFGPFKSATKLINVNSFSAYHRETNLQLHGFPDIVLENEDGTRMIIDDKTAFPKTEDDALFYKYQAQVNFYGFLCEQMEEAYKVSKVGILYFVYEPVPDDEVLDTVGPSTITVQFAPKLRLVDYDPERIVLPLLKKVRELLDMDTPPESADGCKDCSKVEQLSKLFHQTDDLQYLRKMMTDREWREDQAKRRYAALTDSAPDIQEKTETLIRQATPGGMLANWDFSPQEAE